MHGHIFFYKMNPTSETCGYMSTLTMGWHPFFFDSPRSLPVRGQKGKFSLTSGVVILLHFTLDLSRARLLPLALTLECLGENKASVLLHLTNTSCPAPIYTSLLLHPEARSQSLSHVGREVERLESVQAVGDRRKCSLSVPGKQGLWN